MATMTMERSVEEIVAGWRDGELDGPAGPVLGEGYVAQEITATGTPVTSAMPYSDWSGSYDPCSGMWWMCC